MTSIKNQTKKFVIIKKAKICKSLWAKGTGLMLKKKPDYGMIFIFRKEQSNPITMFLVFFPVDLLFLDKSKRVVEIKKKLKPFRDYYPRAKSMYVIELPVGVMGKTRIGDRIEF
jgi:uncharacterized membrane protein (UPF0127 family)